MSFSYRILSGFKDDVYGGQNLSGRFDNRAKFSEIEVTTEPTIDVVALADMKNEARVRHDNDNDMLEGYIRQAMKDVEKYTGRAIANQEITTYWKVAFDYVWLPRPPHVSITSVTEIDDEGTETTITADGYNIFGNKEYKLEFDQVISNQLKIVYQAGYGGQVDDIPQWAKSAVQWQTKLYYEKEPELAVDADSGLAVPAYLACKDERYLLPE